MSNPYLTHFNIKRRLKLVNKSIYISRELDVKLIKLADIQQRNFNNMIQVALSDYVNKNLKVDESKKELEPIKQ